MPKKLMSPDQIEETFSSPMDEIIKRCSIAEGFVDKEQFQIMLATIWGNAVLDPSRSGIAESDLPDLHDFLNKHIADIVGPNNDMTSCFEFIVSKAGQESMDRQRVTIDHRKFLHHFAQLILKRVIFPDV